MAFARQHDLTRHSRVHSGETPYFCHGCRQGFRRSDARSRHWGKDAQCLAVHQRLVEGTEVSLSLGTCNTMLTSTHRRDASSKKAYCAWVTKPAELAPLPFVCTSPSLAPCAVLRRTLDYFSLCFRYCTKLHSSCFFYFAMVLPWVLHAAPPAALKWWLVSYYGMLLVYTCSQSFAMMPLDIVLYWLPVVSLNCAVFLFLFNQNRITLFSSRENTEPTSHGPTDGPKANACMHQSEQTRSPRDYI